MTLDEALESADLWAEAHTFDASSQGWRVACKTLADEVRRLQTDLDEQCRLLGMSGEREAKHLAQIDRLRSALERCEHETTSLRVWNGTEWSYSPYQAGRIAKIARDALNASGAGGV